MSNAAEELQRALGINVDSLKDAPNGGKLRQDKLWDRLGISRATWYRQGKPEREGQLEINRYNRQKVRAQSDMCSTRTIQRAAFIRRYGIPELNNLLLARHFLTAAMVEQVAKFERNEQRWFVHRLLELIRESGQQHTARNNDDEIIDRRNHSIVFLTIMTVDRKVLRRLAKQALQEIGGDLPYRWGELPDTDADQKCWACHSPRWEP